MSDFDTTEEVENTELDEEVADEETAEVADEETVELADWQLIELPDEDVFPRKFLRSQTPRAVDPRDPSRGAREFSVSGPKADVIAKMAICGGYTRQEMANEAGRQTNGSCSVSRVAEVLWGLENAGIEVNVVKSRKSATKTAASAASKAAELDETIARIVAAKLAEHGIIESIDEQSDVA